MRIMRVIVVSSLALRKRKRRTTPSHPTGHSLIMRERPVSFQSWVLARWRTAPAGASGSIACGLTVDASVGGTVVEPRLRIDPDRVGVALAAAVDLVAHCPQLPHCGSV